MTDSRSPRSSAPIFAHDPRFIEKSAIRSDAGEQLQSLLCVRRMQEGAYALCKSRHNRAFKVDLPIERHKQLHCSHFRVTGGECLSSVYIFVSEVLDCMAQDFERVPGL